LLTIPRYNALDNHPAFFITPFHAHCYHDIQLAAKWPSPQRPPLCQDRQTPPVPSFPFWIYRVILY
jgi:hypothetical protein